MKELLRTNDAVVISFVESLLRDAGIGCLVADQNMSVLDGSIGILPRRDPGARTSDHGDRRGASSPTPASANEIAKLPPPR